MTTPSCVKVSASLPKDLWDFVDSQKKAAGHGMHSRVIQQALVLLQNKIARRNKRIAKIRNTRQREASK